MDECKKRYFFALATLGNRGKTMTLNNVIESCHGARLRPTIALLKTIVDGKEMVVFVETSSPQERGRGSKTKMMDKLKNDLEFFENIARALKLDVFCVLMAFTLTEKEDRYTFLKNEVENRNYKWNVAELVRVTEKPRIQDAHVHVIQNLKAGIKNQREYLQISQELLRFMGDPKT